ncbi:coproporphyrinogen dehydrogenase HemZ [Intestinimonas massiliensis]|uniref:Coproporphyrinogen dehydrogenase HemZ n=1 Tax=Intestinimonas massiliensis (ex Afouda et al. 2020) TaxID=1673721 RepID=A0ABS9M7T1_9FIRM|nr:coproporphyrinogen dehydrogenase HemZ [Intestinimonas massiliensis (ex Afouda et al. 2020)]MCG4526852.1 coproporphyrinogen dehydrogenase HemZ [Intestinimonas massiliensis (ex Afouda et al. 2020)]MCQ4807136.1 coproporphyrinogen dehydrogenase HemZ [Intestinimonas massiliensis (ex Afouda et al. 2020)]
MKLYLKGHDYKYATEQMLLTLFPGERPSYPDRPAGEGEDSLTLSLSLGARWATARAVLTRDGRRWTAAARAPVPAPDAGRVERDRVLQRVVKNAFYRAGVQALGREPPWGGLTGVRPVKLPTRALEQGATRRQADRLLRDLYRVSAPRRALALDCAQATLAAKRTLAPEDVSLYVGVPFCPTRCAYCSFVSADVGRTFSLMEPYVDALCREIAAAGAAVRRGGRRIKSVYIGGGTPTTLSPALLDRLMGALEGAFDLSACAEYTVEAGRPDTITAEKLSVLRERGCTRVSVNPQSMDDRVLAAIGRAHSAADILQAWDLVRRAGFPYANMDLIAGLPTDTPEGFRASLDQVLSLGPENVTVHTLALKKGSRLTLEKNGALPAPEQVSAMLDYAWGALRAAGYAPYYLYRQKYMSGGFENVGWCRPGAESLYNICMMEELHTILSLGSGGVTKVIDPRAGSLVRQANPKYPKEYIETLDPILQAKENLTWPTN